MKPCPFCGAGKYRRDEAKHWTGMRNVVLSVTIIHWCERETGQPQSTVKISGKTDEDATRLWNTRFGDDSENRVGRS